MTRTNLAAGLLLGALLFLGSIVATPRSAPPVIPTAGPVDAGEKPDGTLEGLSGAPHVRGALDPGNGSQDVLSLEGAFRTAPVTGGAPQPTVQDGFGNQPASSVIFEGTLAYADPSYGPLYLAIRQPRGSRVEVCGPAACLDRVSTDFGPSPWMASQGRIADVSSVDFEALCGLSAAQRVIFGTCPGTVTIEQRPLPQTSTGGAR
jgi:hypothetical protein